MLRAFGNYRADLTRPGMNARATPAAAPGEPGFSPIDRAQFSVRRLHRRTSARRQG
ncbi:MAG: hypothetical protein L6R45_05800 [Anaerolineae bacterium]|nr:hypothetical protein [Anaerolineae bacterium]